MNRARLLLCAIALSACARPPELDESSAALGSQTLTQVTSFGANPGGLRMWKYVPQNMPPNAPLVLALHACTEQAADYVKAGWNDLADQYKFYVLYPEQTSTNNALTCFNWAGVYGNPANLERGMGENESIKEMVDQMKKDHSIDSSRVFITGQSAGGAQTALMLAVWPDVFAAGAPIAGIPFHCTTQFSQVSTCLNPGISMTAQQWGDFVRQGDPGYSGAWPRVSIWQGTKDSVVNPSNAGELLKQWSDVHGLAQTPTSTEQVSGNEHDLYRDSTGNLVIEEWLITGMDHGVPVDPKNGCGATGSYFLDAGFCSSRYIAAFFGLAPNAQTSDGGVGVPPYDAGASCTPSCNGNDGGNGSGNGNDGGNGNGSGSGNGSGNGSGSGSGHVVPCKAAGCSAAPGEVAFDQLVMIALSLLLIVSRARITSGSRP